jgi:hypothetical protein
MCRAARNRRLVTDGIDPHAEDCQARFGQVSRRGAAHAGSQDRRDIGRLTRHTSGYWPTAACTFAAAVRMGSACAGHCGLGLDAGGGGRPSPELVDLPGRPQQRRVSAGGAIRTKGARGRPDGCSRFRRSPPAGRLPGRNGVVFCRRGTLGGGPGATGAAVLLDVAAEYGASLSAGPLQNWVWPSPTGSVNLEAVTKPWKCLLGWHAYVREPGDPNPNHQYCLRCGKKRNFDIWMRGGGQSGGGG